MTTADDFKHAEFARHPDGRIAARIDSDDYSQWASTGCGDADWYSDEELARNGWTPVTDTRAATDATQRHENHLAELRAVELDTYTNERTRAEKAEAERDRAAALCRSLIEEYDDGVYQENAYARGMADTARKVLDVLDPPAPGWLAAAAPIEALLREIEGVGFVADPVLLSRHLAERGVRVTEDGGKR